MKLLFGVLFINFALLLPQIGTATEGKVLDLSAVDRQANPCTDFYQFACGNWIATHSLPNGKSYLGRAWTGASDEIRDQLKAVLERYARGELTQPSSEYAQKLGDYYASCMDEFSIIKETPTIVREELDRIERIQNRRELAAEIARLHLIQIPALFDIWSEQDRYDSQRIIAVIGRGKFGLPPTTYKSDDQQSKNNQAALANYVAQLLELSGESKKQAVKDASKALEIERHLAKATLTPAELRKPELSTHPHNFETLSAALSSFDLKSYFAALEIDPPTSFNVLETAYIIELNKFLLDTSLDEIKTYLRARTLSGIAFYLGGTYAHLNFQFEYTYLDGVKEPKPRDQRCIQMISSDMVEALGDIFVKTNFSESERSKAKEMIARIRSAFRKNLQQVDWLDDQTRQNAIEKLDSIGEKIGYPDKIDSYSELKIERTGFIRNKIRWLIYDTKKDFAKIGKQLDRTDWDNDFAHEVNCTYNQHRVEIVFPGGMLRRPFFSASDTDAANFGAIGVFMGHELSHAFDDKGSQYDKNGNLRNWWKPKTKKLFDEKAACVSKQYSRYRPLPQLSINGDLTKGENIADIAGAKMALQALKSLIAEKGAGPKQAEFNDIQQFFLAWAQTNCSVETEQALRGDLNRDPHSPDQYRVIGVIENIPEFGQAFGCKEGTPMVPPKQNRCAVW